MLANIAPVSPENLGLVDVDLQLSREDLGMPSPDQIADAGWLRSALLSFVPSIVRRDKWVELAAIHVVLRRALEGYLTLEITKARVVSCIWNSIAFETVSDLAVTNTHGDSCLLLVKHASESWEEALYQVIVETRMLSLGRTDEGRHTVTYGLVSDGVSYGLLSIFPDGIIRYSGRVTMDYSTGENMDLVIAMIRNTFSIILSVSMRARRIEWDDGGRMES